MASNKVRRDKITTEKVVVIEKDTVPKMTIYFESLTERAKDEDINGGNETLNESGKDRSVDAQGKARGSRELSSHEFESLSDQIQDKEKDKLRGSYADKSRSTKMIGEKEVEARKGREEHEGKTRGQGDEEVRRGREARGMQGKEEIYEEEQRGGGEQGKEEGGGQTQEEVRRGREARGMQGKEEIHEEEQRGGGEQGKKEGGGQKQEVRGKLGSATEYAAEKGSQAKDTVVQGAQKTSQFVAEKGRDTLYSAGETAKEYTVPKAEQAKEYDVEKASEAKEAAVDTTKKIGEKAAAAKDVTVQNGKEAAEYAGKVAADVKDKVVVAGWSTAHYTTEKAVEGTAALAKAAQYTTGKVVEGTKAAAMAVEGVAEYAGHKAAEIVSKPLGAAKEAAVSTGGTVKEYTGRKKEEAQSELEAKRGKIQGTERGYTGGGETAEGSYTRGEDTGQQPSVTTEFQDKVEDVARPIASTIQETFPGVPEGGGKQEKQTTEYGEDQRWGGGRILQAICETVVEIVQHTKNLVIGEGETVEKILGYRSNQVEEGNQREGQRLDVDSKSHPHPPKY